MLFVSLSPSCHRQLFGFKTFLRTVYFSNLSLPSVHKDLKGICSRSLEIKRGPKRVHEDGVTYQRGVSESPEPNSQLFFVLLIETLAALPLCLQSWPAFGAFACVGGAVEISHIWQSQQR